MVDGVEDVRREEGMFSGGWMTWNGFKMTTGRCFILVIIREPEKSKSVAIVDKGTNPLIRVQNHHRPWFTAQQPWQELRTRIVM